MRRRSPLGFGLCRRPLADPQLDVRLAERCLQLLDLVQQLPLARVRARLTRLRQPLLAALQKQPLPVRDRLLARLATARRLRDRQGTRPSPARRHSLPNEWVAGANPAT